MMITIKCLTFNPFQENMYVLHDETKEAILIDPGCSTREEENTLKRYIDSQQLKVVGLYNTHCHIDHVLGNQFVKDTYKVPLAIHPKEKAPLEAVKTYAPMYGFRNYNPSEADIFITEKDEILFGKSTLKILFVPGHAPGHLAFYSKEQNFCINGDVLFKMSVGRTDLPFCNHEDLMRSIRQVMFALPDETLIYTGHGETTTIQFEKKYNPFCGVNAR